MTESPLTNEEESLLENRLADAGKKAKITCLLGCIIYFILLAIPQNSTPAPPRIQAPTASLQSTTHAPHTYSSP
ncbi:hypothetical protein ACQ86N_23605 [Puia sp. P3]|uniref:hypothetical protein n=1 Tax=Puia sp. P3 TaxID=3423952 RepID=UPI003D67FB94